MIKVPKLFSLLLAVLIICSTFNGAIALTIESNDNHTDTADYCMRANDIHMNISEAKAFDQAELEKAILDAADPVGLIRPDDPSPNWERVDTYKSDFSSVELVVSDEGYPVKLYYPKIKLKEDSLITFYVFFDEDPVTYHSVSYKFISYDVDHALPDEVISLLPPFKEGIPDGTTITSPEISSSIEISADGGKWTFEGWDHPEITISGSDVSVVGTWKWTADEPPVQYYTLAYKFVSLDTEHSLPDEVISLLPPFKEGIPDGTTIISPEISTSSAISADGGKWTFEGWDHSEITISGADASVIGTWKWTVDEPPVKYYTLAYKFVTLDTEHALPDEVLALLPPFREGIPDGTIVTSPAISTSSAISVDGGKWTFEGWDYSEITISGADASFVGTWKWTADEPPVKYYSLAYKFVSLDTERSLPDEVIALLPPIIEGIPDGTIVTPPIISTFSAIPADGGKWTFEGWDHSEITISGADASFVGTWKWTADEPPVKYYSLVYKFISFDKDLSLPDEVISLLPPDRQDIPDKTTITPPAISTSSAISVDGGKWTFEGWDHSEITITGADASFVGTWKWTADEPPTYVTPGSSHGGVNNNIHKDPPVISDPPVTPDPPVINEDGQITNNISGFISNAANEIKQFISSLNEKPADKPSPDLPAVQPPLQNAVDNITNNSTETVTPSIVTNKKEPVSVNKTTSKAQGSTSSSQPVISASTSPNTDQQPVDTELSTPQTLEETPLPEASLSPSLDNSIGNNSSSSNRGIGVLNSVLVSFCLASAGGFGVSIVSDLKVLQWYNTQKKKGVMHK